MPQAQLPFFPHGTSVINANLSFLKEDNKVAYFHGHLPVFQHHINDKKTFYLITSQFYINGNATQAEISRAFGVSLISLKRAVKLYREKGAAGFYEEPKRRGGVVLTPSVLVQAQQLFNERYELVDVAKELSIKPDTLRKAVAAGKLHKLKKKNRLTPK
jgi:transposase-like protein